MNFFKNIHFTLPTSFSAPANVWDVPESFISGGAWSNISSIAFLAKNSITHEIHQLSEVNQVPIFIQNHMFGLADDIFNELVINSLYESMYNAVVSEEHINLISNELLMPQFPFRNIAKDHKK